MSDAPRGASIQVHLHRCPDCERVMVATSCGDLELGPAEREKMDCDAQLKEPGIRNRSVVSPALRQGVFSRDGHRCGAPGCCNTRFLEVHHIKPREKGGINELDNLITLCSACHRLWHEHGGIPLVATRIPSVPHR